MPHQCTTCGRTFPDGSKEMLSGCPDCGGNKFQFKPKGAPTDSDSTPSDTDVSEQQPSVSDQSSSQSQPPTLTETPADGPSPSDPSSAESIPSDPSSTNSTPSDPSSTDSTPSDSPQTADSDGTEHVHERNDEDTAQASARSDVVSPDELDRASRDVDSVDDSDRPTSETTGPRPDIDELRDELNAQFESIRIVSPGKYELNLMELYERQEYIISLQEDGRYVIEMPDAWGISDE